MTIEFFQGVGESTIDTIKRMIPDPDVTIWMGNKTPRERGRLVARRVAQVAIPLFGDVIFRSIGSALGGFISGLMGFGVGVGFSLLNIGKAWVINKAIDKMIKVDSQYYPIKDEIKKVTDASASVVVAAAYLATTIALPVLGPVGIFTAVVNLALSIGTLALASFELHKKRKDPGIAAQMERRRFRECRIPRQELSPVQRKERANLLSGAVLRRQTTYQLA